MAGLINVKELFFQRDIAAILPSASGNCRLKLNLKSIASPTNLNEAL
jgi:hypothetical protein